MRRFRHRNLCLGLLAGFSSAGCSDTLPVAVRDNGATASIARTTLGRAPTIRDEFLALESEVPGFGGMFVDPSGSVTVRAVDIERARRAQSLERYAVFARMHGVSGASAGRIRVVPSRLTYAQLDSVMLALAQGVWAAARVTSYGINELTGRIEVHVVAPSDAAALRRATPKGFDDVLDVVASGYPRSLQANLHQRARPLDNAFQISSRTTEFGACTAGFMAYRSSGSQLGVADPSLGRYMLTASHCATPGQPDNLVFRQPGALGSARIGQEAFDASTFQGVGGPSVPCTFASNNPNCVCFATEVCSDGDVMLVQLDDSVPFYFGYQTTARSVPNGNFAPDSVRYESLWQQSVAPLAGLSVSKTGQRTGLTTGTITSTCFKLRSEDYPFHQLCQVKVAGRAGGGDSGSPVFTRRLVAPNQPNPLRPLALGIVHTGAEPVMVNGELRDIYQSYFFTPLDRAEAALGVRLVVY